MWTLIVSKGDTPIETIVRLPDEGIVYIVQTLGCKALGLVHEFHPTVNAELGRITVTSSGAKLEAGDQTLTIQSCGSDPRAVPYELRPRFGEKSETIFLRHGDIVGSPQSTGSFTCIWRDSEVQVNSSAADAGVKDSVNGDSEVVETPEEETEYEALDHSIVAVDATQSISHQHPRATPQLSNQRSIVVQETPTIARTKDTDTYTTPVDVDQPNIGGGTPGEELMEQEQEPEPYSTTRARHPLNGVQEEDASVEYNSENTPQTTSHPKVLISRKRPSPTRAELESRKRAKKAASSDNNDSGTQNSGLSTIPVEVSPAVAPVRGRKRKSVLTEAEQDEAQPRSQRSQRSTSAVTTEPYQGDTPCIAISNSAITEKGQAAKFLRNLGGSLIDSVKEPFDILCIRDGDLHKTSKVLQAIATGTPIVTDKWLFDSAKAGHLLSVAAYQPSVFKKEEEWGFKLKDVLGQPQTPFEGYTVHFTTSLHSSYKTFMEIEQVCKAAGAVKVTKKKMDKGKRDKVLVLAIEEGDKEGEKLMQDGAVCYSRDILPTSILRGVLDLDSDEFKIKISGVKGAASTAKKSRGKKS